MSGDGAARFQSELASALLGVLGDLGFALAGAGAIRAHGLTARPTYDVDLFAVSTIDDQDFAAAVAAGERALSERGYGVTLVRSAPRFARLVVENVDGDALDVDLGVDWRLEPPVRLDVGPVLSLSDAIGGKVAAAFSRGEVRDFLDLDSIRQSGRLADDELLRLAAEYDAGFDPRVLAEHWNGSLRCRPIAPGNTRSRPRNTTPSSNDSRHGRERCIPVW